MAADPAIQVEMKRINRAFRKTEQDGQIHVALWGFEHFEGGCSLRARVLSCVAHNTATSVPAPFARPAVILITGGEPPDRDESIVER